MENISKLPTKRKELKSQLWVSNPTMELDFIAFCIESAGLHGYKGSSLKTWSNVILQMNTKYNLNFDQKALKNKWTGLRNNYIPWRSLTHKTGHGQNEDGTFNWSDEIWEAEIEKNKNVAQFRYKPLRHFKELEQLFEGTFSTGDEEYIATVGDKVALAEDAMNIDVDVGNSQFVDIDNDSYFSSHFEASPVNPSPTEFSPGNPSPTQGSTPERWFYCCPMSNVGVKGCGFFAWQTPESKEVEKKNVTEENKKSEDTKLEELRGYLEMKQAITTEVCESVLEKLKKLKMG